MERFTALRDRYFARGAYDFSAEGVGRIAVASAEGDRMDLAEALATRNLSDWPESAGSHQAMAQVMLTAGNVDEAIRHLEHALELDPQNRQIQRQLQELTGGGAD